jgi:hypothetical protein
MRLLFGCSSTACGIRGPLSGWIVDIAGREAEPARLRISSNVLSSRPGRRTGVRAPLPHGVSDSSAPSLLVEGTCLNMPASVEPRLEVESLRLSGGVPRGGVDVPSPKEVWN